MGRLSRFPPEVRERTVRLVMETAEERPAQIVEATHGGALGGREDRPLAPDGAQGARQVQRDAGIRPGPTMEERERVQDLERENRGLKRSNEILRNAAVSFVQAELDCRQQ